MGHKSEAGAVAGWVLVLAASLGCGLAVGTVLATTGTLDVTSDPAPLAAYDQASYFDCPGGSSLDVLIRGDRVFLTGRDTSGGWVQLRHPFDATGRVWMRAAHVTPDAMVDLPVVSCDLPADSTTSTSTQTGESTTTVASLTPSSTPTATTATTVASTTPSSTPTVTTAAPTAVPSVGSVSASAGTIWEGYAADEGSGTCTGLPGQPIKSVISAVVSAPAGVQSVVLQWSVGGVSGSAGMTESDGSYRATLGRFDAESPNVVPQGGSATITVTVRVTDALGRVATAGRSVTLMDCTFG